MKNKKFQKSRFSKGEKVIVLNNTCGLLKNMVVVVYDPYKDNKKRIKVQAPDNRVVKIKTKYLTSK